MWPRLRLALSLSEGRQGALLGEPLPVVVLRRGNLAPAMYLGGAMCLERVGQRVLVRKRLAS